MRMMCTGGKHIVCGPTCWMELHGVKGEYARQMSIMCEMINRRRAPRPRPAGRDRATTGACQADSDGTLPGWDPAGLPVGPNWRL
jgi:hypothetical protein